MNNKSSYCLKIQQKSKNKMGKILASHFELATFTSLNFSNKILVVAILQ